MKIMVRTAVLALMVHSAPLMAAMSDNSGIENDPDYVLARAAIEMKDWPAALPRLLRLQTDNPTSADIQNLLGITYRKLKDYPVAKRHYDRALELDPAHLPTLEYQGEWFIETGDLAAAKRNLEKLQTLCGKCHEYVDLLASIAKAEGPK